MTDDLTDIKSDQGFSIAFQLSMTLVEVEKTVAILAAVTHSFAPTATLEPPPLLSLHRRHHLK